MTSIISPFWQCAWTLSALEHKLACCHRHQPGKGERAYRAGRTTTLEKASRSIAWWVIKLEGTTIKAQAKVERIRGYIFTPKEIQRQINFRQIGMSQDMVANRICQIPSAMQVAAYDINPVDVPHSAEIEPPEVPIACGCIEWNHILDGFLAVWIYFPMSIYHYLFICEAPLLSTAWTPAPIWGLHTITPKLRRGLGISTCLPARTQITPYPKHRLTTTERDRGLGKGYWNGTELGTYVLVGDSLPHSLSFWDSLQITSNYTSNHWIGLWSLQWLFTNIQT